MEHFVVVVVAIVGCVKIGGPLDWGLLFIFCTPKGIGAINLPLSVRPSVSQSVRNTKLQELALRIFLIFWIQLGDDKCRKVTESDFWKKIPLTLFWGKKGSKRGQNGVFEFFLSKTALKIFLIFGMKLRLYKGFILALFWKKNPKRGQMGQMGYPEKMSTNYFFMRIEWCWTRISNNVFYFFWNP